MPRIGPTFVDELKAAGLDPATTPIAWSTETAELYGVLPAAQRAIWDATLQRHDPTKLDAVTLRRQALYVDPLVSDLARVLQTGTVQELEQWAAREDALAVVLKLLALMPPPASPQVFPPPLSPTP